jgi:hypothetical protein
VLLSANEPKRIEVEMDMNGGLMKTTSLYAIAAAGGLVLGMGSSLAADLGGNCCADLEERVAELEATTARKGNRKVSLTISGQVDRAILIWDDGKHSNAVLGVDNSNSSTRVAFTGDAKILPGYKAGFSILMDIASAGGGNGARSFRVSQNMNANNASATNGDAAWRLRDLNWWIESERYGRTTVGRLTGAGPVDTPDLGGISLIAGMGPSGFGGNLFFRRKSGALSNLTLDYLTDRFADYDQRQNGVKYTSPTFSGFILSASAGTTADERQIENQCSGSVAATVACATPAAKDFSQGEIWGVSLQYAGEYNGFKVAAGVGWERARSDAFPTDGFNEEADVNQWGVGGAVLHVATGLFVQGDYQHSDRAASLAFTQTPPRKGFGPSSEMFNWDIQWGISRNWCGLGNTNLYGEYGEQDDWSQDVANPLAVTVVEGSFDSNVRFWGAGVVQNIDAAAMNVYVGWRHFEPEAVSCAGVDATGTKCIVPGPKTQLRDLDVIGIGSRIKF